MGKSGGRRKKGVNVNAPSSAYGNGNSTTTTTTSATTTTTTTTIATPAANGNSTSTSTNKASAAVDGVDLDSSVFLKRAHELKEEGNRRFQSKDYAGALQQYELALKIIPKTHPDRAVFHSNRAACLLQMKPVQFDTVVAECTLALHVQPRFPRALLRRARAFEALGKFDLAVQDVQSLLQSDPNNQDALEISRRLRVALGNRQDSAQRDLQRTSSAATTTTNNHRSPSPAPPATSPLHHPLHSAISSGCYPSSTSSSLSSSSSSSYSGTSPAALGASAVPGAPLGGLGPCLPARAIPLPKKHAAKPVEKSVPEDLLASAFSASNHANNINDSVSENGVQHLSSISSPKPSEKTKTGLPSIVLKPSKASPSSSKPVLPVSVDGESPSPAGPGEKPIKNPQGVVVSTIRWRPLKLVYDHDIRLAQMPDNCTFRVLREIVAKRFNSSKSVLIKYKDLEGDLVTITGTKELRIAESCNDILINTSKKKVMGGSGSDDGQSGGDEIGKPYSTSSTLGSKPCVLEPLRLHIVEVSPEQEPPLVDEEEEEEEQLVEKTVLDGIAEEGIKSEGTISDTSVCDAVSEGGAVDKELAKHVDAEEGIQKEKNGDGNQTDCKEVEIDDWLFEFAQLFRSHVGIDPDAHVDLHELGMELCSEALEETVTSEEAQTLFDMAASKFQEVAALAFFNWGNVHMCAARKRIPLDESSSNEVTMKQLRFAYDWVQERYSLAGQKYEEALRIKPDFYEGLLALGQQHFETAKLHWSYALASKVDLTTWDSSETIKLFNSAEEKMKAATEMWEKLEEQRNSDVKDPLTLKKEDILNRRKKSMGSQLAAGLLDGVHGGELAAALDEAAEQAALMRSQIHLFWGNMLFERSQVEFKLDMPNWKNNLDNAVGRFKLAGASEADIEIVLKNHQSSVTSMKEDEKKTLNSAVKVQEAMNGKAMP